MCCTIPSQNFSETNTNSTQPPNFNFEYLSNAIASSVLPHWILIWLMYQTTNQSSIGLGEIGGEINNGLEKLKQLVYSILDCATIGFDETNGLKMIYLESVCSPEVLMGYFRIRQKSLLNLGFWVRSIIFFLKTDYHPKYLS